MLDKCKDMIFVERLILWGKSNYRDFPWRKQGLTVYESIIAEVFLRKTSSTQVEGIYQNFINSFPGPTELLEASETDIEEIIRPLGLYKQRLKVLKDIAQVLISKGFPKIFEELIELPHVGDYIARAVTCFCLGHRKAIVDTNVIRVYSRFFGLSGQPDARRNKEVIMIAENLLPIEDYNSYNYALLDFGALICTGRGKPKCEECTMKDNCHYRKASGEE